MDKQILKQNYKNAKEIFDIKNDEISSINYDNQIVILDKNGFFIYRDATKGMLIEYLNSNKEGFILEIIPHGKDDRND